MICKYCEYFLSASKREIVGDRTRMYIRQCEHINGWVNTDSNICDGFIMAQRFWCDKDEQFREPEVCMNRQEKKRSCFHGCKERVTIDKLMTKPLTDILEEIRKKEEKKLRKRKKWDAPTPKKKAEKPKEPIKTEVKKVEEITHKKEKPVKKKKETPKDIQSNQTPEKQVNKKESPPKNIQNNAEKKLSKAQQVVDHLKSEGYKVKEKTDEYIAFRSGDRGIYLYVGKRGGIKEGKTFETSIKSERFNKIRNKV